MILNIEDSSWMLMRITSLDHLSQAHDIPDNEKFKSDYTNKWYMHLLESVLENETRKVLWDFEMQTDLISPRRR